MAEVVSSRPQMDDDGVLEGVHFEGAFTATSSAAMHESDTVRMKERAALVDEIIAGLDMLTTVQLKGMVSLIRARRGNQGVHNG